jgi:hypothetical protein
LDVLRTDTRGWPENAPRSHAIGLLGMLRAPVAIPELVSIVESSDEESAEEAAEALAELGQPGFDALLPLCASASMKGYRRYSVIDAARLAAGNDTACEARLAEVLRSILDGLIAKAREELRLKGSLEKKSPINEIVDELLDFNELNDPKIEGQGIDDNEDDGDTEEPYDEFDLTEDDSEEGADIEDDRAEDDYEPEPSIAQEVAFVVGDLADLRDPLAVDSIKTAFQEGLIDETIIDQNFVDKQYKRVQDRADEDEDEDEWNWLDSYRERYEGRIRELAQPRGRPAPPSSPLEYRYDDEDEYEDAERPPVTAPIRNIAPRLGRNDPCWCGSGKKYKKCHLGIDTR